uniref:uncharacterized protein n=1 Tax=Myxine glutinosa TaxID=7769 RepID=UPI00358F3A53
MGNGNGSKWDSQHERVKTLGGIYLVCFKRKCEMFKNAERWLDCPMPQKNNNWGFSLLVFFTLMRGFGELMVMEPITVHLASHSQSAQQRMDRHPFSLILKVVDFALFLSLPLHPIKQHHSTEYHENNGEKRKLGKQKYCKASKPSQKVDGEVSKTTVLPPKSKPCPLTKITGAQNPEGSKEIPGRSPIRRKNATILIPRRKYGCTVQVDIFYQARRPNFRGGFKENANESHERKRDVRRSPFEEAKEKRVSLGTAPCPGRQNHSHPKAELSSQSSPSQRQPLKKKGSFSSKEQENERQKQYITSEKRHKETSNVTTKGRDVKAQSASRGNSGKSKLELTQDRPNKAQQTTTKQQPRDKDKSKETALEKVSTDSGVLDPKSNVCATDGPKGLPILGQTLSSPLKTFSQWWTIPEQELFDETARLKKEEEKKETNVCSSSDVWDMPIFQDGSLSKTKHPTVITKDNQKLPYVSVVPSKCHSQRVVPLNHHEEDKVEVEIGISLKEQRDGTMKPEGKDKDTNEFFKIMEGERKIEEDGSVDDCVICQSCAPNTVIYTCGHQCLCFDCATKVKSTAEARCPLCRTTVLDIIRVFKP